MQKLLRKSYCRHLQTSKIRKSHETVLIMNIDTESCTVGLSSFWPSRHTLPEERVRERQGVYKHGLSRGGGWGDWSQNTTREPCMTVAFFHDECIEASNIS
jgi:hypothetical protein